MAFHRSGPVYIHVTILEIWVIFYTQGCKGYCRPPGGLRLSAHHVTLTAFCAVHTGGQFMERGCSEGPLSFVPLLQRVAEVFVLQSPQPRTALLWPESAVSAPAAPSPFFSRTVLLTATLPPSRVHLMAVTWICCCRRFSVHFFPREVHCAWGVPAPALLAVLSCGSSQGCVWGTCHSTALSLGGSNLLSGSCSCVFSAVCSVSCLCFLENLFLP